MTAESQIRYSERFIAHLRAPRHQVAGDRPEFEPNAEASFKGHSAGSRLDLWLAIDNTARLSKIGWKASGMPHVVAGMSALAEWLVPPPDQGPGIDVKEALTVTPNDVAQRLGGLPPRKIHETIVGPKLLRAAIDDHFFRHSRHFASPVRPAGSDLLSCECFTPMMARLRELADKGHPFDAFGHLPEAEQSCSRCAAYAPSLYAWLTLRQTKQEG